MARAKHEALARRERKRAFSARLNDELRRLGWSVAYAAKVARVHQNRMFRFSLGLSLPHRPTLLRIADGLGVDPAELAPWEADE